MYTYAFLSSTNTPPDLPQGISGSLELVTVDQLAALVEPDLPLEQLQTSDDLLVKAVLCHDQVIRELFEQTTVLPLRFGTCFVSLEGLIEHLGNHSTEYLEKLDRLTGQAEYLLKLTPTAVPEVESPEDLKGREYFLAKKRHYQIQTEWQQQQQAELQLLLDIISQVYPHWVRNESSDGVERIYLLSNRQPTDHLRGQVQRWQEQCLHWEFSLGEALPPYHFV